MGIEGGQFNLAWVHQTCTFLKLFSQWRVVLFLKLLSQMVENTLRPSHNVLLILLKLYCKISFAGGTFSRKVSLFLCNGTEEQSLKYGQQVRKPIIRENLFLEIASIFSQWLLIYFMSRLHQLQCGTEMFTCSHEMFHISKLYFCTDAYAYQSEKKLEPRLNSFNETLERKQLQDLKGLAPVLIIQCHP